MGRRLSVSVSGRSCIALALFLLLAASSAAQVRRETMLNGVTINAGAPDVLKALGLPHYIGPALPGAEAIEKILNPPPLMAMGGAAPAAPAAPGMPDGGVAAGPPKPKPEEEHIVWLYEGVRWNGTSYSTNLNAGHATYVIFDKYGKVAGVVMSVDTPATNPGIYMSSRGPQGEKVGFGTRMIEMVTVYDWPDPLARLDKYYFAAYPDRNVTFSLDSATRKVVVMAIGMPVTVIRGAEKAAGGAIGALDGGVGLPGGVVPPR
ncbi:MAG TPA: hypothetical protein PLZ36_04775 [Armatimonadota bacterium]|nr:hypothetical protein [Armatimonadota bacterium]HOS43498.1 hypothetical protein [Armatimonadota bacterium]